jgi:hypothetical protein
VLEQLNTKSVVDPSSSSTPAIMILVKWRPFGRLISRRTIGRIPSNRVRLRDPVSLGEVEGVFHVSLPCVGEVNSRSSRRGKEQIRSKMSMDVLVR